jgi:hypothetical protein
MRIKGKDQVSSRIKKGSPVWRVPAVVILFAAAFLLGYISNPAWNFNNMLQSIKKTLIKTDQAIMEDVRQEMGLYTANGLATIFLDIPFDSLLSIEEKRIEALIAGILLTSDEDLVPASMHLNDGESFAIKIRLKGDWTDHLVGDKWSFRIHIDDPTQAILGMRRFSVQAPETRNYEKEWVYHQNLIQEGVLAPRYYFVNVVQNGKYNGIYALEESFTEDLLESQARREGPIIRFSEDLLWKNWENLGTEDSEIKKAVEEIGEFWLTDAGNSEITAFRQNRLTKDELLSGELFSAIELLYSFTQGLLPGEQVFDQELWGKYFAISDLWGAGHAMAWHNLRFYYNPVTGLLEPVVFDALPFEPSTLRNRLAFPFAEQGYIQKIFRISGIQKSYVANLERVTQTYYLDNLELTYEAELNHFHQILTGYLEEGLFGDIPPLPWHELRQRAVILAKNLQSPQPIQGNYNIIQVNGTDQLELDLTNLMILPVEITELIINETSYPIDLAWCDLQTCQENLVGDSSSFVLKESTSISLFIPLREIEGDFQTESTLNIIAFLLGGSTQTTNPLNTNYIPEGVTAGTRPRSSLENALEVHSFLEESSPGQLAIKPGTWEVEGDLILPDSTDLTIPAGTTLLFDSGAILLVNGSLNLAGREDNPILLTARDLSWGGIVALGDGSTESAWTQVGVEHTAGIIRGGWVLTGGITFYENNLSLDQVRIRGNTAEDALNIIRADFDLQGVEFAEAASDAFDGDFSTGTVENCTFQNISGDGLDFSGSVVSINQTNFYNIGDKAVSVGENSKLVITDSLIENTNIGIASKDLSEVTVKSVAISQAKVAGLASYIKKPQYGPAYLIADQIDFTSTAKPTLCQTGSVLILAGVNTLCEDIDVESLYDQGILGN